MITRLKHPEKLKDVSIFTPCRHRYVSAFTSLRLSIAPLAGAEAIARLSASYHHIVIAVYSLHQPRYIYVKD